MVSIRPLHFGLVSTEPPPEGTPHEIFSWRLRTLPEFPGVPMPIDFGPSDFFVSKGSDDNDLADYRREVANAVNAGGGIARFYPIFDQWALRANWRFPTKEEEGRQVSKA